MNPIRFATGTRFLCGVLVVLAAAGSGPSFALADMREAARKAVPATVAVQWRVADAAQPAPPAAPPVQAPTPAPTQHPPYPYYPPSTNGAAPTAPAPPSPSTVPSTTYPPTTTVAPAYPPVAGAKAATSEITLASGTLVTPDGLIVTPRLDGSSSAELTVTFSDGKTLPARIVVEDERSNLLLLKIDADELPFLELAEDEPALGQSVLAAYCSGMRQRGVARGIIGSVDSALPRERWSAIGTDVMVGSMSAGGPLVDSEGRLLGIVVAKTSRDAQAAGPAYAIPVEYVRKTRQAHSGDDVQVLRRGYLGVSLASQENATSSLHPLVNGVVPDSPAAKAGIEEGDLIETVNGQPVATAQDVLVQVGKHVPGDTIAIVIRRDDESREAEATLAPLPSSLTKKTPSPTISTDPQGRVIVLDDGRILAVGRDGIGQVRKALSADRNKTLAEALRKVEEASGNAVRIFPQLDSSESTKSAGQPVPPAIRVQRSDTQKALDELNSQLRELREQLVQMRKQVETLNQRLEAD